MVLVAAYILLLPLLAMQITKQVAGTWSVSLSLALSGVS